jgi:TolA-binding protein
MLAKNPGNELARFSLGKALFDDGKFAEALESFLVCVQRKPDWMVPTILIGRCHTALGDKASARASLEKARQLAIDQHHDGPLDEINGLLAAL